MDIEKWKEMSARLKDLKTQEAALRREICQEIIGSSPMKNGMVTVRDSVEGYPVKAKQGLGYNLSESVLGAIWEDLSVQEQSTIKMKPTLQVGPYKKLPEDSLLHEAITTRLSMPTLEVGDCEY